MRPGGAQLPRPESEVAPAALENGVHGGGEGEGPAEENTTGTERGGGACPAPPRLASPPQPVHPERQRLKGLPLPVDVPLRAQPGSRAAAGGDARGGDGG